MQKRCFLVLILPLLILTSCITHKERQVEQFFATWEQETATINEAKTGSLGQLEQAIQAIALQEYCTAQDDDLISQFPKLKYRIVDQGVKISILNNLNIEDYPFTNDAVVKDSLIKVKVKCEDGALQLLYLTDRFKRKALGNLKYGFGSALRLKNEDNARVLLESHHSVNYYTLPFRLDEIVFNAAIDSAVVETSTIYDHYGLLYTIADGFWEKDKELYHLME